MTDLHSMAEAVRDLEGRPRTLAELPPIADSHEPLEDQFFRVLAGIPRPEAPDAP